MLFQLINSIVCFYKQSNCSVSIWRQKVKLKLHVFAQIQHIQKGISMAQNNQFYPELLFQFLKNYSKIDLILRDEQNQQEQAKSWYQNFFDFSNSKQSHQRRTELSKLFNVQRQGNIGFHNIVIFLKNTLSIDCTIESIKTIEQLYHVEQYGLSNNQKKNEEQVILYPLPANYQFNKNEMQTSIPDQLQLTKNEGINYNTFLKLFLPKSIPNIRQNVQKRKLLYENINIPENLNQLVEQDIQVQAAQIFKLELDLHKNSEFLRVQIAQDSNWNPVQMFNTLDINCNGQIDFQILDYIMKQTQYSFKPKDFEALLRRLSIINPKSGQQSFINFEDFRRLTLVHSPYFKSPVKDENLKEISNKVLISGINDNKYQIYQVQSGINYSKNVQSAFSQILNTNSDKGIHQVYGDQQIIGNVSNNEFSQLGLKFNTKIRQINLDDPNCFNSRQINTYSSIGTPKIVNYQTNQINSQDLPQTRKKYFSQNQEINNLIHKSHNQQENLISNQKQTSVSQTSKFLLKDQIELGQTNQIAFDKSRQIFVKSKQNFKRQSNNQKSEMLIIPKSNFDYLPNNQYFPGSIANIENVQKQQREQSAFRSSPSIIPNFHQQQSFGRAGTYENENQAPWRNMDNKILKNITSMNEEQCKLRELTALPVFGQSQIRPVQLPQAGFQTLSQEQIKSQQQLENLQSNILYQQTDQTFGQPQHRNINVEKAFTPISRRKGDENLRLGQSQNKIFGPIKSGQIHSKSRIF